MNKGVGRIIVGVLFIGLGGFRIATDTGGIQLFGVFMSLYGLFSVGHGIYLLNSKPKEEVDENED